VVWPRGVVRRVVGVATWCGPAGGRGWPRGAAGRRGREVRPGGRPGGAARRWLGDVVREWSARKPCAVGRWVAD